MASQKKTPRVSLDLLKKYECSGPRYTSYPTAVEFNETFNHESYDAKLAEANRASAEPLSFYVHLPFCEERCSFCGCHVVITKKRDVSRRYIDYLKREIEMLADRLPDRRGVVQYHWGGGTPTYQSVDEIREIWKAVADRFEILPEAEVAIEVDPRVTTREQIDVLRELGFNRLSLGVQDFTPEVQAAINRNQDEKSTRDLYNYATSVGFDSMNLDLIYGLPLQTPKTFADSLKSVIELRPGRVAVYSFAFVPWIRGNQKGFDESTLPSAEEKLELFYLALDSFLGAGYRQIGMDHFALPEDELSVAMEKRALHRNFMGYTTKPASDMLGVGVSSIGDLAGAFAQNEKKLSRYYEAIDSGRMPVVRGFELGDDDKIRRYVIANIMCNFHLDRRLVEEKFGIDFDRYFAVELEELQIPEKHGFVTIGEDAIELTQAGRLFVRNVCMIFDSYLRKGNGDEKPVFSKTI